MEGLPIAGNWSLTIPSANVHDCREMVGYGGYGTAGYSSAVSGVVRLGWLRSRGGTGKLRQISDSEQEVEEKESGAVPVLLGTELTSRTGRLRAGRSLG